jgi:uncharacterized protein YyaL (SSP411 family)
MHAHTHTNTFYLSALDLPAGFDSDYANMVQGLLDLYEAGGGLQWLQWAQQLQHRMDQLFWDPSGAGGYFSTTGTDPTIKLRIKEE